MRNGKNSSPVVRFAYCRSCDSNSRPILIGVSSIIEEINKKTLLVDGKHVTSWHEWMTDEVKQQLGFISEILSFAGAAALCSSICPGRPIHCENLKNLLKSNISWGSKSGSITILLYGRQGKQIIDGLGRQLNHAASDIDSCRLIIPQIGVKFSY